MFYPFIARLSSRWPSSRISIKRLLIGFVCWIGQLVVYAQTPTVSLVASNQLSCDQLQTTLTATSSCTGNVSYQFRGPNDFSVVNTTGVISVSVSGGYSVTATSGDGCIASSDVRVDSNLHPDYLPLVDLYKSTGGPNWINKTGWLTNCDPCSGWFGIACTEGRVTGISLAGFFPANNLRGTIPATIGNLSELTTLNLSYNQYLSGEVPASIGRLAKLRDLNLSYNRFSGTILDKLTGLTSIQSIILNYNSFSGDIPTAIGNLVQLKSFYTSANYFTGSIPVDIGNLSNLEQLSVGLNWHTGSIPVSLGNLTRLTQLYLSDNRLTGIIPSEIGNLTQLQTLYLSGNQLTGPIPDQLGNLTAIQIMGLSENKLTGTIPTSFSALTQVRYLYLTQNQLSGLLPAFLGSLTQLRELRLETNQFTGSIPASLGNLSSLSLLQLQNNRLTGCIPSSLTALCGRAVNISANIGLPSWSEFCSKGLNGLTSVKDGDWQDPAVWSCGRLPTLTDIITLQHTVKLGPGSTKTARQVRYSGGAKLIYEPGGTVKTGQ